MKLLKKYFFLLILIFQSQTLLFAQDGHVFLFEFSPDLPSVDNINSAIVQEQAGEMFFANRKGLMRFDGAKWHFDALKGSANCLSLDSTSNRVFVGGSSGVNFVDKDDMGYWKITDLPLSDSTEKVDVFMSADTQEDVFFLGLNGLYRVNKVGLALEKLPITQLPEYIFALSGKLYGQMFDGKLFVLNGKMDFEPTQLYIPNDDLIVFHTSFDGQSIIIGTALSRLYIFDGKTTSVFSLNEQSVYSFDFESAQVLNGKYLAIGTYAHGCAIINLQTKETEFIDVSSGLYDNEVYCLGVDKNSGIWIGHQYGFTRYDKRIPIQSFDAYIGLQGKIQTATYSKDNHLFVGTSSGLYKLVKVTSAKQFAELISQDNVKNDFNNLQKQLIEDTEKNTFFSPKNTEENSQDSQLKLSKKEQRLLKKSEKKKNKNKTGNQNDGSDDDNSDNAVDDLTADELLKARKEASLYENLQNQVSSFFTNKEKNTAVLIEDSSVGNTNSDGNTTTVNETKPVKTQASKPQLKAVHIPSSLHYVYQKIKGIEQKVRQIIEIEGDLLAITNDGVYLVRADQAKKVYNGLLSFAFYDPKVPALFVQKLDGQTIALAIEDNYTQVNQSKVKNRSITSAYLDKKGNLWLSSPKRIYQYKHSDLGELTAQFPVENPFADPLVPYEIEEELYFLRSQKVLRFDQATKTLVTNEQSVHDSTQRYINVQPDIVWVKKNDKWSFISSRKFEDANISFLNMLPNFQQVIATQNNGMLLVITQSNKLFRINLNQMTDIKDEYEISLKSLKSQQILQKITKVIRLEEEDSWLDLEFYKPSFFSSKPIEYQFWIQAPGQANGRWSEWSTNSKLTFSQMQVGKHVIKARVRDAVGDVYESDNYLVIVSPPFWKQWWFYLIEISVLLSFIFMAYRLNRSKKSNRIFTRVLTYFALIVTVEFFASSVENMLSTGNNPFYSFLIQATLALVLLPLELFMMRFIRKKNE